MPQFTKPLIPVLAVASLLAACGSSSSTSTSSVASSTPAAAASSGGAAPAVKTASNSTLGATVLVDSRGMTLYRLTGEQNGKWICASAKCVQVWPPLSAAGGTPSGGVGSLATAKRPDGTMQVTYKGSPLYTFAGDKSPGDAKGQGIKDKGSTWIAVTTGSAASKPAPAPATSTSTSSGGGGGYGY